MKYIFLFFFGDFMDFLKYKQNNTRFDGLRGSNLFYLSCRFILIFAAFCAIGIFIARELLRDMSMRISFANYFSSFVVSNVSQFILVYLSSAAFGFFWLISSAISSLTFFCPAFSHFAVAFCGVLYGICIATLTSTNAPHNGFISAYMAWIICFAIILSLWCAQAIRINRLFLSSVSHTHKPPKPYISPITQFLFLQSTKAIVGFALLHLLYCVTLYILNIIIK